MNAEAIAAQFGRNLAEARSWAGLTQAQLSDQVSIVPVEIARFETGVRCPRLDRIVGLADAVGVQVRDLLFEIE
jgi:ribosome-binding protein aMBF1 (putative translation factor)